METQDLTWLNASFIGEVLPKAERNESIKVFNITVKPATAKGDNFQSNMQRVIIELSRVQKGLEIRETRSVIAKILLQGGTDCDKQLEKVHMKSFNTEISMMVKTLPKVNKILAKLNAPSLTPQCLYVQNENPIHLIIEDLAVGGFRMALDHHAGLDMDHCLLVVRNIATFHASSVALVEKDPKAVRVNNKSNFTKDYNSRAEIFFKASVKLLAEEVFNWPDLSPRIAEKVSHLSSCIFEKSSEAARFNEDDFNVLNHGDLWGNNAMFRYDDRPKPIDIKFVDFQASYYGSPAIDVLYFLGASASEEIRSKHREFILREYHNYLIGTMAKLKCSTEAPSFENLQKIFRKRITIEVISSLAIFPYNLVEGSYATGANEILNLNGNDVNRNYRRYQLQKATTGILAFYDRMGFLDF